MHLGLAEALRAYLDRHSGLAESDPILGFGRSRSDDVLKAFCLRYGKKFSHHTLRRTFGRNLWLRGIPIETISELLGHVSTDMTRLYLGLNLTDMRKAISEYGTKSELQIIDEPPQRRVAPSRAPEPEQPPARSTGSTCQRSSSRCLAEASFFCPTSCQSLLEPSRSPRDGRRPFPLPVSGSTSA